MAWFDLPRELRTQLLQNQTIAGAIGDRLHYQELPQSSEYPHIWFTRNSRSRERCISEADGAAIDRFVLEIVSNQDAESLVDQVQSALELIRGTVGGRHVDLVEVEDADDDYLFESLGEGEPDYQHALDVVVYSFEE